MPTESGGPGGSYWTDGDMMFRVHGTGREMDRIVKIRRPFALVGRSPDSDLCVRDAAVSDRHVYAHLDPRGVYVVDLLTRTGTRINGLSQSAGWLRPDQSFEVAGRRVTLLRMRINGEVREPDPSDADLLAETTQADLVGVTLEPSQSSDPPWVLGSELVFLGWSSSCGIQIQNKRVARAHCAIVRGGPGAYLVDLSGQNTWVGDEEISGAAALHDGQSLTIGSATFTVRLKPPSDRQAAGPPLVAPVFGREADPRVPPSIPPDLVPAESQNALLAWMMGMIQGSQGEVLRHQSEFQRAMTQLLREIQEDNAKLLSAHLERMESVDRELASLRAEIQRRAIEPAPPAAPPLSAPAPPAHGAPSRATAEAAPPPAPPPHVAPLCIPRTVPEPDPKSSAAWLLERVSQLENENHSAWKNLLGRLSALPKRSP